MALTFASPDSEAIPLTLLDPDGFEAWVTALPAADGAWVAAQGFTGQLGQAVSLPGPQGVSGVAIGVGTKSAVERRRDGALAGVCGLPKGVYTVEASPEGFDLNAFALGWLLAAYRFALRRGAWMRLALRRVRQVRRLRAS